MISKEKILEALYELLEDKVTSVATWIIRIKSGEFDCAPISREFVCPYPKDKRECFMRGGDAPVSRDGKGTCETCGDVECSRNCLGNVEKRECWKPRPSGEAK